MEDDSEVTRRMLDNARAAMVEARANIARIEEAVAELARAYQDGDPPGDTYQRAIVAHQIKELSRISLNVMTTVEAAAIVAEERATYPCAQAPDPFLWECDKSIEAFRGRSDDGAELTPAAEACIAEAVHAIADDLEASTGLQRQRRPSPRMIADSPVWAAWRAEYENLYGERTARSMTAVLELACWYMGNNPDVSGRRRLIESRHFWAMRTEWRMGREPDRDSEWYWALARRLDALEVEASKKVTDATYRSTVLRIAAKILSDIFTWLSAETAEKATKRAVFPLAEIALP